MRLVLTGAVCTHHFHRFPHYWSQLFQRNNYRVRAANDASLAVRPEGLEVFDLFSLSLSTGGRLCRDVVHFYNPFYIEAARLLLANILRPLKTAGPPGLGSTA